MEEYIKKLLEQIRFEKAHKVISDEIRLHIEDQIEENIAGGMDKETAEKSAVEDMGDPVGVGIELDKVHRPQIAWGVIVAAVLVGVIGTMIHLYIANDSLIHSIYDMPGFETDGRSFIIYTVLGITAMLFLYLVDYTTVARYSRRIAVIIVVAYLGTFYGSDFLKNFFTEKGPNGELFFTNQGEAIIHLLSKCISFSYALMFLLIPLYAGILYKYRGQSYGGLIKALLWIFIPRIIPFVPFRYYNMRAFIVVGSMLVQLTYAIKKDWIKVRKIPSIISVWLAFIIYLLYFTRNVFGGYITAQSNNMKSVMDAMKLLGGGELHFWGGDKTMQLRGCITSPIDTYVLTYVSAAWGLIVGLLVVMTVAALIVFGFVSISKSKNQLGQAMGCGCLMWIAVNAIANIIVGFGIIPEFYVSFFPFISSNNIVISYVFLGILVSVYKYKDAYSKHVDIGVSGKVKDLES